MDIAKAASSISKRRIIISFALACSAGVVMMGFFAPYFTSVTGGVPYPETKFFYVPHDLFGMAGASTSPSGWTSAFPTGSGTSACPE